jgi:alpha-ketoglutarate-dependent taurine dioxygenase
MAQAKQPAGVAVEPLGTVLGASVRGIDLSGALADTTYAWIHDAVVRHGALVFRGQNLDAAQFHAFASGFGPLQHHVLRKYRHKDFPGLSWLTNVEADGTVDRFGVTRATEWHTDGTYTDDPPALGILHALEAPSEGGGTLFVSMSAAYESLPADEKAQIAGLTGLHRHGGGPRGGMYDKSLDDDQAEGHNDVRHPAVRPHPANGMPVLYVNTTHTRCFEGITPAASAALVTALVDRATRREVVYHHRWRPGDLLIWDEHGTMHRGEGAYDPAARRIMLRAIVQHCD